MAANPDWVKTPSKRKGKKGGESGSLQLEFVEGGIKGGDQVVV